MLDSLIAFVTYFGTAVLLPAFVAFAALVILLATGLLGWVRAIRHAHLIADTPTAGCCGSLDTTTSSTAQRRPDWHWTTVAASLMPHRSLARCWSVAMVPPL